MLAIFLFLSNCCALSFSAVISGFLNVLFCFLLFFGEGRAGGGRGAKRMGRGEVDYVCVLCVCMRVCVLQRGMNRYLRVPYFIGFF